MGMAVDGDPVLKAWASSMGGVAYPLLSDFHPKGSICAQYGVLDEHEGHSQRAVFIIDKTGIVRFKKLYKRGLPNVQEILKELDKL